MKSFFHYSNFFIVLLLLISCDKKNDDGCLGCGIDTTDHEYSFHVNGSLVKNCAGEVGSFKTIELYLFYKNGLDSIVDTDQTDENGRFAFSYKKVLAATFSMTSQWESFCLIKVPEDSVTYFVPGLRNLDDLYLNLNDSLNLKIYLDFASHPLSTSDTLYYTFEPTIINYKPYPFKVGGPVANHTLINTIIDKWRFIEYYYFDPKPSVRIRWMIDHGGSWTTSSSFVATSLKLPCVMEEDSIIIDLK